VTVTIFLVLFAGALGAQELPDPGRRLSKEELEADPDKRPPQKAAKPRSGPRDPQACERSRQYYLITCGARDSRRSHSQDCGEAYALWHQSCS
jgi:hypothetical protein